MKKVLEKKKSGKSFFGESKKGNNSFNQGGSICFNKDCVLRKKATCRGSEGCPGYKGRP